MFSIEDDVALEYESGEEDLTVAATNISNDIECSQKQAKSKSSTRVHKNSKRFGIFPEVKRTDHANEVSRRRNEQIPIVSEESIKDGELNKLYVSLGVRRTDRHAQLHSVYVFGVDGLSPYQIQRIFAEYGPCSVEMVDTNSCNVIWEDDLLVAKMLLQMTKSLRRVRRQRQAEEGELLERSDAEEEDGEMREECDDDVIIEMNRVDSKTKRIFNETVEIDIDEVDLPPGKWRVVTKHVDKKRLILVRFSTREDILKGRKKKDVKPLNIGVTTSSFDKRLRVRPGLNIFDDSGNELEWDYEHDTRFYEKDGTKEPSEIDEAVKPNLSTTEMEENSSVRKRKIISRGRGSKRFKYSTEENDIKDTMSADFEEEKREERRRDMDMRGARKESDEFNASGSDDDADRLASLFRSDYRSKQ